MGIGMLGARSVVSLLSSTALAALVIFLIGQTRIRQIIENEDLDTIVLH